VAGGLARLDLSACAKTAEDSSSVPIVIIRQYFIMKFFIAKSFN
jgi:hypothetical protein